MLTLVGHPAIERELPQIALELKLAAVLDRPVPDGPRILIVLQVGALEAARPLGRNRAQLRALKEIAPTRSLRRQAIVRRASHGREKPFHDEKTRTNLRARAFVIGSRRRSPDRIGPDQGRS